MKTKFLVALLFLATMPIAVAARTVQPTTKKITLVGELEKGRLAIGGETTGWILRYRNEAKQPQTIEVDFSRELAAKARGGATVRVTGTIVSRQYVERGTVATLVVSEVEELAAPK